MSRPTLSFTVTGKSLNEMLAESRTIADGYFGEVPHRLASFPVRSDVEVRAFGDGTVRDRTFTAEAVYEVTAVLPTPHPPGYFETDDDGDEVPIP